MKKLLLILLISTNVSAQKVYYVSPSGSDSNPGSIDKPFRTWQKLFSGLNAGDTGYVRGGFYSTTLSPGASDWQCAWQNKSGNAAAHIVVSNFPGEVPVFDFTGFFQINNTTALRIN